MRPLGVSPRTLRDAPPLTIPGEQIVITAVALPATACALSFDATGNLGPPIVRTTFADGTGDLFWLLTIPAETPTGYAAVRIGCGADPVTALIAIDLPPDVRSVL